MATLTINIPDAAGALLARHFGWRENAGNSRSAFVRQAVRAFLLENHREARRAELVQEAMNSYNEPEIE